MKNLLMAALVLVGSFAGGAFAFWLLAGTPAMAQGSGNTPTVLRANEIELTDAEGKPRLKLGVRNGSPGLSMTDAQGNLRFLLGVDGAGVIRLGLANTQGKVGLGLQIDKKGTPTVGLADTNGTMRMILTVMSKGPAIGLLDEEGDTFWTAP